MSLVELQLEVGDITLRETFIVMTNLTSPLIGLRLLQANSKDFNWRQKILIFPWFSMQLTNKDQTYSTVIKPILNPGETILQPGKPTTVWVLSQIYTNYE